MSTPFVWSEVRPATPASLLRSRAAERGERTAFVFLADGEAEGDRLTYGDLDRRARGIAAALRQSLAPGDRALLLYPPGLEFIAAFFGCLYAGVIAVPAYPPRPNDRSQGRLRAIARDAEPRAALTTSSLLAVVSAVGSVPELAAVRWIPTDTLEGSAAELPDPDPGSVAFLQYTSGSTSTPKGVMVTHANLLHNERMIGEAFGMDEESVVVGWLPLYHDMGLIGNVLQPLHAGGSCVLMAPVAFLQKPLRWLEAIHRWRGTTSGGPNFAYELCLRRIGEEQKAGLDLSSWRLAYNGAEPVRVETLERFAAAFAPCGFRPEAFYPCYGLAEATLFVSGGEAGTVPRVGADEEDRRRVSCGRAWAEQRIAVVEPESGLELPAGRVGEIWIAGPSVARGYWRDPEATERDFQARLVSGDGPFLRTGDLGFWRDGELYVTGRIKDLVIIRGRNHYPQDIELTAERSHPDLRPGSGAAFSVEISGEERLVVVQEVERRRREGFEEVAEAVRRAVAAEHEVQVQDVVLVRVGTVPKTSSGKVRRRACRSLYLDGELAVVGRSAVSTDLPAIPEAAVVPSRASLAALEPAERRSAVERFLRQRAAMAVGVPVAAIDAERPLTALGLDSLSAIELKAAVESALGVPLPLADLLEGAGTGELAAALLAMFDGEAVTDGPALRAGGAELGAQPLSFGQKALWFIDRLAPEGGAYNVAVTARARRLDPAALRRALTALTLRHAALRSVFPVVDDEPARRVLDQPEIDFPVDCAGGDAAGWSEARLAERLADEAYRPFDLARGPVLRVRAFDRGDGEQALLLAVHHIAVDFASLAVVVRDLAALYRQETGGAPAELEPLPFGYSDFVRWQAEMLAGPRGERLWGWWREALAGLPDLDLPTDRPRPPLQTYRGGARTLELPPGLSEDLRALAAEQGATLFMVLLAAFQAQLARYAGQEDFAVGSPAAGRTPELAGAVGYFVSPVALRADLAGDPPFRVLLERTRATVLAGLEHGDFPFALLAERLRPARDPARPPLFQVMFLLQRARPADPPGIATFALGEAGGRLDLGGMELESLRLEERRAQFDLTLRMAEEPGGRLRASLEFNADLFDAATAERMLGHFRTLLAGAVEHPERPVSRLPLLTPAEREQALVAWNAHAADHPTDQRRDVLLHGLFEEQAERTPAAEALVAGSLRLTYEELNRRAEELARQLRSMGVGPETRVGVRLGRSAELVVSLLGVLKAGGAYVPLDPRYPQERLALMQEDSGARVVIDGGWDWGVRGDPTDGATDVRPRHPTPHPANLAYLIYTSGSTGRPKAVAITHRSAAGMVQWARGVFGREELAGVLASTSVAFDLSVFEIFVPLAWGGRVILAENALELPGLAAAGEVTLVNTVPSALAELVRHGGLPASVRTVNLAGEPIPPALAEAVHALPGGVRLYNLYGPSEDTTYSTWTLIAPGSDVTIGRQVDDTRASVLDRHRELVPVGVPGELFLGGAGLARGYLDRPELTAERFVPDPFSAGERLYRTGDLVRRRADGDLDFLGRIDHQVKIRGYRVELGEVEAALAAHPAVRETVVLALPEPGGGQRLAAYVVAEEGESADPAVLRAFLKRFLPDAFVPTGWKALEALPLSPNGKVDRKALARLIPEAEGGAAGGDAGPWTPMEQGLAALVAESLGVAGVGLHDDFFVLGGHSLLAARVASRASRLFGVDLPVSVLFQAPTVGALAARISEAAGGAAVAPPVVPVLRPHEGREDLPLSFAQQRLWFLDRLQPGGAAYNMPGAAELVGALDAAALTTAFAEVLRRHEALRTRFAVQGGHPVQVVDPPSPVALETVDLGSLPEGEREAAAAALMGVEAARPFDLARGPLLRALLLRLGPERHHLLLTLHHMVADGWSLGLLLGELAALYGAFAAGRPSPLPELPVQYTDFVVWQRHWLAGETLDKQLLWWTAQLAGAPTTLDLPADRPRPAARTQRGGLVRGWLPRELADGVRGLARRRGATPFMALLAAFQTLLLRVTRQEDLLVGSAVAGRTRPEVEGLIGLFVNTLVLRGALAGDPTFLEALEQARERTTGAWAHQDLPVERLVEELQPGRELGLTPLFQVVLVLQSAPVALELPGLAVRRLPVASGTAKFDLTLELTEQEDGLAVAWELSRDLFEDTTVERLAGWFARLLAGAVQSPERRLSDLPLLGEAELRQLLVERNPAPTAAPVDVPVHRLFEEQVARGPERIALVQGAAQGEREVTYAELNARANRLARRLDPHPLTPSPTRTHTRPGEGGPEPLVGVLLERSVEMIVAFLAVLKAGGAYVPLDPSWPRERLADLVEEAGIRVVITEEWFLELTEGSEENLPGPHVGRLAYAMFTSGSTGRPKTVGVEHRSIVRLVRDTDFMDFGPDQVFLQLAAPAFDAATLEVWGALLQGARLVLAPPGPPSLEELGEILARQGVTTLWLTAGLFHQVVESRIQILGGLRQLLAGGDVLGPAAVNRVLAELPGLRLVNGYGPTENTTFTLCHPIAGPIPPGRTVPIGRPIPGTRIYVVDRAFQPVPDLVPGELLAGGEGLARGYLGRPDLTAERFVPSPFGLSEGRGERLYRTGDLVRRLHSGEIEFLGRIDRQVKIRGFRVEPGEIEATLTRHPAVAQAAVLVHEPTPGDRRLLAFVVGGDLADLRTWLTERLPAYLIPTLAPLPALPLTPNGKVDRQALGRLATDTSAAPERDGFDAPRTPVEELLATLWAEVLGVPRVGVHDDFFSLGGHSLLATRAVSRIVDTLHVDLPLSTFFEAPTVAGLAERLFGTSSRTDAPPLVPIPRDQPLPLSFAQQRLWFLHQLEPDSPAYHVSGALRLAGPLRPEVLEQALSEIVRRHEALRTVFVDTEAGPIQRILPTAPIPLPVIDLRGAADPEAEAGRLGLAEARRLFDLATGPVLRAQLLRLGGEEHLLVVVLHHIASDGWSLGVMLSELAALYAAFARGEPSPLAELPVQYADFAEWQRRTLRGRLLERQLVWWRQQLADPPVLDLPGDHPRPPAPSGRGGHLPVALPAGLARDLQTLARGEGATLYMVLLAAFATLLGRWSGQDDLTVGSPVANRDRQEIEPLIGCFVNTLTLRVRLAGDPAFRGLLARVREVTLGAYDHQGVPFERLVEELAPGGRERAHSPLFQVLLVLQNAPLPALRMGGLVLERHELPTGTAKFDLTLALAEEAGGLAGTLEHSTDLFEPATAARLLGHLAELLRGAADDPGRPLSALPLLTAGEREQILGAWNDTAVDLIQNLRLPDLVAAQAARTPDAPAVRGWRPSGEDRLTYAGLLARADRLAAHLAGLGVGPEVRVGVCLDRTADLPVVLLAVLRAGGAYVPLDPAYPRERLEFMLSDSGASVLITQRDLAGRCGPFGGVTVWTEDPVPAAVLVETGAVPQNLAYLIYTSGSTGVPKAVAIEHRSAVTLVRWALCEYSAEELAGVLFSTSVCFDLSIFELFVPLAAGGQVVVAANALELPSLPFAGEVTLVNTVPSALAELLRGEGFPASVRTINLAGEPLKGALVDAAYELPGVRRVANLYGPSEDTTYSTGETIPAAPERPGEPLIGRPIAHTQVYLLDRDGNLVPEGVPGELFLAGAGLARGYLGRAALTAERFVPDPFARAIFGGARLYRTGDLARWRSGGRIEYLGRIDHQVKIRGFRIELGEIEAALARHPAVGEALVLARDDEAGRGRLLAAFLVRRDGMEGADLRPAELRRFLRRSLPEHMVPAAFAELPALPLTPNGKIDRRTLERLRLDAPAGAARQGDVAPRTPTEELLAALWCEVLGRERVGVHDSFFELGGHSLLATRLVSRVRATFGRDLPLARLFDAPTIAELARALDEGRGRPAPAVAIRPVPRQGELPLSFAQERLWFLDRIQPGAAYSVPLALRLRGTLDAGRLGAAFGSIVARHEALRTVFTERDGEPAQLVSPPEPPESWPLPLIDLAGQPEPEAVAAQLAELDALRPFDLAVGPLLRTTLLRLGATAHVLLLNMHHIVSDGWSLGVLLQELEAFYGGTPGTLPELPVQYADFAVWQKDWLCGQELERQMAYWRQQLAGAPAVLDLPADRPRPLIASSNGARRYLTLDTGLTARLAEIARRQGATTFMLLLAAWGALLHRWSRQADLNIGTPIAGRNRSEIEHLVGFFVNTLVLRVELADDPAFPDLLARLRQTALAAYDHQDLPFEKLVDELRIERDMSHQPLFQVMFALQNAPLGALELPGLTLEPTELGATVAKFDLTLNLMELRGALAGSLEYNTDLFDGNTAARLAGHLVVLLEGIAADTADTTESRISELPLLTPGERQQLTLEWTDVRRDAPECRLLHELVERQVDRSPEAPAVEHGSTLWSFGELESRANRLAWFLRELGVGPEARVGLFVERGADMVAAMLGVLKAGGAYVPLDPAYPRERLTAMLEDSGVRVVLTQERLLDRLPAVEARAVCLDRDREEIARYSDARPAARPDARPASGVQPLNPAYIIYTSGSTGQPKGVVVPHEAVCVYSQACSAVYGSGPGDRNLQFSSISFDASVEEIYSSLTRGATLVVRGEVQEGISEFLERCRTQRITLLQLPTAFWNQMVTAMEAESLTLPDSVRVMFVGGEKMQARRLISWWGRVHPGFKLINAYGPTETTVAAALCPIPGTVEVHDRLREVPIGRPLSYVRAYVLDRSLRPVPIGVAGELCLGGPSLARGYLDRPALTAEKLIPNPLAHLAGEPGERLYRTGDLVRLLPDGLIEFIGRTDHQVKLRGYRIELGEIETILASHPALGEVVVVTREDVPGEVRLVAYAAFKGEKAPTTAELRIWLEERLPSYMVPAAIQVLPALPVSAHGKVDRRALERLAPQTRERAAFAAPRSELEETIAAVWREVFGLQEHEGSDALGVHDNFFDVGGSSLLLVKLHSRLQKALERQFPLVEIFTHPTIAALAASLEAEAPAQPSLDKARARTETRRESMRQMQQLREQRRRGR